MANIDPTADAVPPSGWRAHYESRIESAGGDVAYYMKKVASKRLLLSKIQGRRILEAGCGTAVLSASLAAEGRVAVAVDRDREMISLAARIAGRLAAPVRFVHCDIVGFDYSEGFDCIFSSGVLEHFEDERIVDLLRRKSESAATVVFTVPSDYFEPREAIYGDERFLPLAAWRDLIHAAGCRTVEEFSHGPRRGERTAFLGFVLSRRNALRSPAP